MGCILGGYEYFPRTIGGIKLSGMLLRDMDYSKGNFGEMVLGLQNIVIKA